MSQKQKKAKKPAKRARAAAITKVAPANIYKVSMKCRELVGWTHELVGLANNASEAETRCMDLARILGSPQPYITSVVLLGTKQF